MTKPSEHFYPSATTALAPCHCCAKPVPVPEWLVPLVAAHGIQCDPCATADAQAITEAALKRSRLVRADAWAQLCPHDFQNTEPHRLPSPSKLQLVLKWQFGRRGLVLHGPTGTGKSRCAWLLLRREFEAGRSIRALDHGAGLAFAAQFNESAATVRRWTDDLKRAEILFMDDVFKAKLTDAFESALFSIVSARTEQGHPIIATLNDTGQTLAARLSPDRGEALVRRLREYADAIALA